MTTNSITKTVSRITTITTFTSSHHHYKKRHSTHEKKKKTTLNAGRSESQVLSTSTKNKTR
ncbi:hypothetical protein E2C01_048264 [Portunus trituberculatus]|uniref:Uncharacterized protein n=1 Tax=Portunus trituberculatus TaxID=210409 RepID=A0A5B7GAP3_PORTR|nr:hypothetical protein [Portunus trituberculatus]